MKTLEINGDVFDCPFADDLPPLTDEERAGLEADIRKNGVLQPVIFTRHNGRFTVIDGHNRAGIAAELGIRVPVCERKYASFDAMKAHALELNLHRRHLTREQRQALITAKLKSDPEQSDRSIAAQVGVDHKTAAAVREQLVSGGEIPHLESRKGKDGKPQPAKKPKVPKPAPQPPGEPANVDIDSADPSDEEAITTPIPPGVDTADWAERFRLLALVIEQAKDAGRIRDFLESIVIVANECERELDAACPRSSPVDDLDSLIFTRGAGSPPLPFD
jgi:hypothetical protein